MLLPILGNFNLLRRADLGQAPSVTRRFSAPVTAVASSSSSAIPPAAAMTASTLAGAKEQ